MRNRSKAPEVCRAVGYVRVSKALASGKQEMSPAAQEEKIRALALLQNVELTEVYADRETAKQGSVRKRQGLMDVLALAKKGQVNRIIIAKLDRLTRSVMDLGEILTILDKAGVSLASATETWMDTGSAAGRMILNIITSVAQWEREAIGERTRAVLQFKREHRQVYNHIAYGFRAVGVARQGRKAAGQRLEPVPEEQAVIKRMLALRKKGATLRAIADELNAKKVPTKIKGGKWHASSVANALRLST
jgi:DNA invertase Pin-like site-specific DNA recombinase